MAKCVQLVDSPNSVIPISAGNNRNDCIRFLSVTRGKPPIALSEQPDKYIRIQGDIFKHSPSPFLSPHLSQDTQTQATSLVSNIKKTNKFSVFFSYFAFGFFDISTKGEIFENMLLYYVVILRDYLKIHLTSASETKQHIKL